MPRPSLSHRRGSMGKSQLPVHRAEPDDASSEFPIGRTPHLRRKRTAKAQSLSTFVVDTPSKADGSFFRTTVRLDTSPSLPRLEIWVRLVIPLSWSPLDPYITTSAFSSRSSASPSIYSKLLACHSINAPPGVKTICSRVTMPGTVYSSR
ncbi:hypothetical protein BS47DRAFT_1400897 [Hydnum rufescens UP504]|uniref:Uncharacterized protein n=1 Tax=Hydnum rufescens UP504 TaxID=1448309 RepID=A0A9P6AG12_9AGAM|nr:hypothetical protein BS47DRAFT_1400897 [Hydnum rufescens UP504]